MKGKSNTDIPVKEVRIYSRVTREMYELIQKNADAAHMSIGEYIRHCVLHQKIVLHQELVFNDSKLLKALGDLGKIGSNLN